MSISDNQDTCVSREFTISFEVAAKVDLVGTVRYGAVRWRWKLVVQVHAAAARCLACLPTC